jgi:hypothetical protein
MTENRVRYAWNLEKASDGRTVVAEVFNDNLMGRHGDKLAWAIEIEHSEGEDDKRLAAVRFQSVNPHNVQLTTDESGSGAKHQIAEALVLAGKPLMQGEIAEQTGLKDTTVRGTLHRNKTMFHKTSDGRYKLAPAEADNLPDPW